MGGGGGFISDIISPVADVAAAVFAPGALPAMLTAEGIGAATGAVGSAITGGNVLQGALSGAGAGAITGGLGVAAPETFSGLGGVMAAGGIGGGVTNVLQGGNPLTGAARGAVGSGLGYAGGQLLGGTSAISAGGTNVSAPEATPNDLTTESDTPGQSAQNSGWRTNPIPVTGSPLSNVGTFAGEADPFQVLGSITSPAAGGTGRFVNNPLYGTGVSPSDSFQTPGGTGVSQSSLDKVSDWLLHAPASGASGSVPNVAGGVGGASAGPSSASQILSALKGGDASGVASGVGSALVNNPQIALGALGLGASALLGQQQPKGYNQLNQEAQQLASQGSQLQQSLNGALPAGAQSALNQASNSAKARIRSTYAASGLSGSTMEAQALAGVDQTVAAQGFQMADQLYQQGVQESGMASNLYNQIMQVNAQSDAALALSIGNFSAALAGGGSGISRNELKSILEG